jgi:hypothetical protein
VFVLTQIGGENAPHVRFIVDNQNSCHVQGPFVHFFVHICVQNS